MDTRPQYLGINEFVERMASELMAAPFRSQYQDEADLRADVREVVQSFTSSRLDPLALSYDIWQQGDERLMPVSLFGADFHPDMVVEVGKFPAVALDLELVQGDDLVAKMSRGLGQAIIYSRRYPAVIVLIWGQQKGEEARHWLDREFETNLWRKHKIKLVVLERA